MDHWLKSLLLESSSVSAEEMLSPESVPRLPSWFVPHKTGLPRLPFLFVLDNELRLHPSLEGMDTVPPGKDQLNSIGALVAVIHRSRGPAGTAWSLSGRAWVYLGNALLQQAPWQQDVPAQTCSAAHAWHWQTWCEACSPQQGRPPYYCSPRSGPCSAACSGHLAAVHLL